MFSKSLSVSLALLTTLLLATTPLLYAQKADMTDDGLDELFLVQIDDDKNLDWQVLSSDSNYASEFASESDFGSVGDDLAPGDWFGRGEILLGAINDKPKKKQVEWSIVRDDGTTTSVNFGRPNNVVIGGADFNGDGVSDAAVIPKNGKGSIRFSPFLESATTGSIIFPKGFAEKIRSANGQVGYIRFGDTDQLLIARSKNNRLRIRTGAGNNTLLTGVPRGKLQGIYPILNDDGEYHLLTDERISASLRRIRIFDLGGTLQFSESYTGDTTVVGVLAGGTAGAGHFAVKNGTTLTVVSPYAGGATTNLTIGDGVLADIHNVNKFAAGGGGSSSGGSSSGGGGSSASPSGQCKSTAGFGAGRLWKPDSDVSDNRGGKPVVLLTGGNKNGVRGGLDVFSSNGVKICRFTFKGSSIPGVNNGADHYFSGWVGGCSRTCSQLRSLSRNAGGNGNVMIEWKGSTCLGPVDPCSRAGGI